MAKRLGKFELPNRLIKIDEDVSNNFARYVADPFEKGLGHTMGNMFRRVLLSAIEGAGISSVYFTSPVVHHEFQIVEGIVEDFTEIVLNLKKLLIKTESRDPIKLVLDVTKEGPVTAGDIQAHSDVTIVNPDLVICTLDKPMNLRAEFNVIMGRGYRLAEDNKKAGDPIGTIPIDCCFSPIKIVQYSVEDTRVGKMTDFDKLTLTIATDGRISPDDALQQSTQIISHHLKVFSDYNHQEIQFENERKDVNEEDNRFKILLNMSVNEIELSVRSSNCLNNANITTVGELVTKTEPEMLRYRNFGKKSLNEIKARLEQLGLSLGMRIDPQLLVGNTSRLMLQPTMGEIENSRTFRSSFDNSDNSVNLGSSVNSDNLEPANTF